jgi:hypothetical protein
MAEVKLHLAEAKDYPPLFHRYPGQYQPQAAFIELDLESGDLSAQWNAEIGNPIPPRVRHRCALRWSVPIYLSGDEVNALLEEIAPVARRLLDGARVVWDGADYKGRLDDDAEGAEEEIEMICSQPEGSTKVCTPEERLGDIPTADLLEQGETVVHAATRIRALAWGRDDTYIDGDLVSYLTERLSGDAGGDG